MKSILVLACVGLLGGCTQEVGGSTGESSRDPLETNEFVAWVVEPGRFLGITGDIQVTNGNEIRHVTCLTLSNTGQCKNGTSSGALGWGEFCWNGSNGAGEIVDLAIRIWEEPGGSFTVVPQAGSGKCVNGAVVKN